MKAKKKVKIDYHGIVHQYARCHQCDKTWGEYRGSKARKQAYAHAKKTGHTVTVETATATRYN